MNETVIYASPGRRLLGFVIDFFVIGLVMAAFLPFFDVSLQDVAEGNIPTSLQWAQLAVLGVYQVSFVTWRGQTPGKIALRIKVVEVTSGHVPTLAVAAIRWVIVAAAMVLPAVGLPALAAVYGWLLFDRKRQGIHDKAAGTVVIDLFLPTARELERRGSDVEEP